jgi:NMD protein affecting ribosome stability and mRNA decay
MPEEKMILPTPQKFKEMMEQIFAINDEEIAHRQADDLMCWILARIGYEEGVKIFLNSSKWYA